MRAAIGSQCTLINRGVTCVLFSSLKINLAATFCINYKGLIELAGRTRAWTPDVEHKNTKTQAQSQYKAKTTSDSVKLMETVNSFCADFAKMDLKMVKSNVHITLLLTQSINKSAKWKKTVIFSYIIDLTALIRSDETWTELIWIMTLLSPVEPLYSLNWVCFIIDGFDINTVIFLFITVKRYRNKCDSTWKTSYDFRLSVVHDSYGLWVWQYKSLNSFIICKNNTRSVILPHVNICFMKVKIQGWVNDVYDDAN